jgi:hypothetical protein
MYRAAVESINSFNTRITKPIDAASQGAHLPNYSRALGAARVGNPGSRRRVPLKFNAFGKLKQHEREQPPCPHITPRQVKLLPLAITSQMLLLRLNLRESIALTLIKAHSN